MDVEIVFLIVGVLAIIVGVFVVRYYRAVWNYFSARRREMFGDRLGSPRSPRPGVMRVVGACWIALGALFVIVILLRW